MKKSTTPCEEFTVEQFQERWDELMDRVYEGESFIIISDSAKVVITPATDGLTSLT